MPKGKRTLDELPHGKANTYNNYGCRCDLCITIGREEHLKYRREQHAKAPEKNRSRASKYYQTLTPEQREARNEYSRVRRTNNVEQARTYAKEWRSKNPEKCFAQRLRQYGLTTDQFWNMFEAQGSKCACCLNTEPGHTYDWCIDHDHDTELVRGIVCWRCNKMLAWLGDSEPKIRASTAMYLRYLDFERREDRA